MTDKPTKKLILVVHGIGEQVPGECLGLLTSSMPVIPGTTTSYDIDMVPEESANETGAASPGPGPGHTAPKHDAIPTGGDKAGCHPSAERDGMQKQRPGQTRVPKLFSCHSRRMASDRHDHVFAEVYWADVVVTGREAIDILFSLARVLLGLGHIVRESARANYDNYALMRRLSNAVIYLLHGPIAAINTVLLFGAIMGMSMRGLVNQMTSDHFHWILVLTLPFAIYTAYQWAICKSYLWQSYWCWLLVTCLVLSSAALIYGDMESQLPVVRNIALEIQYDSLGFICQDLTAIESRQCKQDLRGYYFFGVPLLLAQQLIWLLTVALMTLILGVHLFARASDVARRKERWGYRQSLVPVALSAMALFWILILCCIWAFGYYIDDRFMGNFHMFEVAFFLVYVNWGFALVLVIVVILILMVPYMLWAGNVYAYNYYSSETRASPDGTATGSVERPNPPPRLIVPQAAAFVTMFCPPVLLALAVISLLRDFHIAFDEIGPMNDAAEWASANFSRLLIVSAALAVGLYWMREQLRVGIGLGSDIISYFRAPEYDPKLGKDNVFPDRERIEDRFIAVARRMVHWHEPDEVVIIAHSQGTVIALDVLRHGKIADLIARRSPRGRRVPWRLFTMGSPYTHIYGHYFRDDFPVPQASETGLEQWDNIFRIDDFVGTHIQREGRSWPSEHPIARNGHTHYWVDDHVLQILKRTLFDEIELTDLPTVFR